MNPWRRRWSLQAAIFLISPCLTNCARNYPMDSRAITDFPSLKKMFSQVVLRCFGRYAIILPRETEQIFGFHDIDGGFVRYSLKEGNGPDDVLNSIWREASGWSHVARMERPIADGPVPDARYFWYYADDYAMKHAEKHLWGVVRIGDQLYGYRGLAAPEDGQPASLIFSNMTALMRGMRPWDGVEVPREPGVCIEGTFIHEPTNRFQEIMSSGFYFPSLPDVSFSVMSNKNASVEGDNGKGLLQMVDEARRDQLIYPYTFLRRGKRTLHGLWDGEEVLARRSDGALMFDWELVGEPGNVARPSSLEIGMRTKVADNKVGASPASSLSDEEAVALWDHLLENVKFRVAVPGATPQSVALR